MHKNDVDILTPKSRQILVWMKKCWIATVIETDREKLNKKLKKIKKV